MCGKAILVTLTLHTVYGSLYRTELKESSSSDKMTRRSLHHSLKAHGHTGARGVLSRVAAVR